MFDSFFNSVLGPLVKWSPIGTIIIVSFTLTAIITLVYKLMTDQNLMKSLKEEIKGFQKEMKNHKNDQSKMMEIQKKAMGKNMAYMKHSLKPTLLTFVPIIIVFGWLRTTYTPLGPLAPIGLSWIWVYILSSIIFSIVLRKILKVH